MQTIQLGALTTSKFILGSNPFSTFSHQGHEVDQEMRRYFTTARIKEILHDAEAQGVNTLIARGDHHVMRLLFEYWEEGGSIQWLAQTCPELGSIEKGVQNAISGGAVGCHIHGGVMDNLLANNRLDEVPRAIALLKEAGLVAGIAGHTPEVFRWAEEHADVDYYMCSYYNPIPRKDNPEHVRGFNEQFLTEDRDAMVATIATMRKPVVHYKVLAAGRNTPADAFAFVNRHLRPQDAVCVGIFPKDKPEMLAEDIALLGA
jgi:hypothetical protein